MVITSLSPTNHRIQQNISKSSPESLSRPAQHYRHPSRMLMIMSRETVPGDSRLGLEMVTADRRKETKKGRPVTTESNGLISDDDEIAIDYQSFDLHFLLHLLHQQQHMTPRPHEVEVKSSESEISNLARLNDLISNDDEDEDEDTDDLHRRSHTHRQKLQHRDGRSISIDHHDRESLVNDARCGTKVDGLTKSHCPRPFKDNGSRATPSSLMITSATTRSVSPDNSHRSGFINVIIAAETSTPSLLLKLDEDEDEEEFDKITRVPGLV
ncbi:hypothetical protein K440DRAFT_638922 [Wilcoxina mikolae CBS 423.85]|nr:hypothetical protein K440DRAFT_638922 [Wilcoxina mikolae CBS 423.85]